MCVAVCIYRGVKNRTENLYDFLFSFDRRVHFVFAQAAVFRNGFHRVHLAHAAVCIQLDVRFNRQIRIILGRLLPSCPQSQAQTRPSAAYRHTLQSPATTSSSKFPRIFLSARAQSKGAGRQACRTNPAASRAACAALHKNHRTPFVLDFL